MLFPKHSQQSTKGIYANNNKDAAHIVCDNETTNKVLHFCLYFTTTINGILIATQYQ